MTERSAELHRKFQLYYDNVGSYQAPGLTMHEISVYLSKAQKELVNTLYGKYEQDEATRKALAPLVATYSVSDEAALDGNHIVAGSKFYVLPVDLLYVLYEALVAQKKSYGRCEEFYVAEVVPVPHDEFHRIWSNPFRFTKRRALRLDVGKDGAPYAEIVVKPNTKYTHYYMRYLRRPKPIILANLDSETIDGVSIETLPELDLSYDDVLVKLAATTAYQDYKS